MKKSPFSTAALIIIFSFAPLLLSHFILSRNETQAWQKADIILARHIHESVLSKLNEPLVVARTMNRDTFLISALKDEDKKTQDEMISLMKEYLGTICAEFNYHSVSVISHKTHRYYTDKGLLKIVNPKKDPGDIWLTPYENGSSKYNTSVYRDVDDINQTRIYINRALEDSDGNFLGVVSTSLFMTEIQALIRSLEEEFSVTINMADETGLVTISSVMSEVETASLSHIVKAENTPDEGWKYLHHGLLGFAVVKYEPDLRLFFIMRSEHASRRTATRSSFYVIALIILFIALYTLFLSDRKNKKPNRNTEKTASQTDFLTGLPNRNFFKQMYGERGVFNTTRYRTIAVFDIDFFKEANDSTNGDLVLTQVVQEADHLLQGRGMILRWGGDEFLMLLELNMESAYAICRQFCKNVEASTSVTVSVGLIDVRLSDTIKKNYYRAAQNCYQVKEMGGNGVIKG